MDKRRNIREKRREDETHHHMIDISFEIYRH